MHGSYTPGLPVFINFLYSFSTAYNFSKIYLFGVNCYGVEWGSSWHKSRLVETK